MSKLIKLNQKNIYLGGVTNRQKSNIKELLAFLKKTYCGPVGYEYMSPSYAKPCDGSVLP